MEEILKKTLILFQKQISLFKKIIERKNINYSLRINDKWIVYIDKEPLNRAFQPHFIKPLFYNRNLLLPQFFSSYYKIKFKLFVCQNQIFHIDYLNGRYFSEFINYVNQNDKFEDYDFLNIYPLIKDSNRDYPIFKKFQETNIHSYMFKSITKSDLKNILILLTSHPPLKNFSIYF